MKKICKHCRKEYSTNKSENKFCSHKCYALSNIKYLQLNGINLPQKRIKNRTYIFLDNEWRRKDHSKGLNRCPDCSKFIHNKAKKCFLCSHRDLRGTSWGKQTEETKRKLSKIHKGKRYSRRTEFKKGVIPWSKGKTGVFSEETLKRMSENGKKRFALKGSPWKGKKHSIESRKKMSITAKRRLINPENYSFFGKHHSEESKRKMSIIKLGKKMGEEHPNWLGGKSFEPYTIDFNRSFKEAIRKRDNYSCLLCNLFEDDSLKLYNRVLVIHHIDYNKKNTFPQNCCTLCIRCNILINKDREIWKKHFQELLAKLYNYQYSLDQKIILDFTKNDE